MIYFRSGMCSLPICRRLHSEFGLVWSRDHGATNTRKSYFVLRVNILTLCTHTPLSWAAQHTTMCPDTYTQREYLSYDYLYASQCQSYSPSVFGCNASARSKIASLSGWPRTNVCISKDIKSLKKCTQALHSTLITLITDTLCTQRHTDTHGHIHQHTCI